MRILRFQNFFVTQIVYLQNNSFLAPDFNYDMKQMSNIWFWWQTFYIQ